MPWKGKRLNDPLIRWTGNSWRLLALPLLLLIAVPILM